jgi:hypothetical protein
MNPPKSYPKNAIWVSKKGNLRLIEKVAKSYVKKLSTKK